MYSAIHKGRSQTEEEREKERWIRDPCGRCNDINESPGYYCGQFPHPIRSSAFRVLRVSPLKQAVHHRPTDYWLLQHQRPINLRTHTHHAGRAFKGQWFSNLIHLITFKSVALMIHVITNDVCVQCHLLLFYLYGYVYSRFKQPFY